MDPVETTLKTQPLERRELNAAHSLPTSELGSSFCSTGLFKNHGSEELGSCVGHCVSIQVEIFLSGFSY